SLLLTSIALPVPTLFPYTTLFRSRWLADLGRPELDVRPKAPVHEHVADGRGQHRAAEAVAEPGEPHERARFHGGGADARDAPGRSEEHTSELQSRENLVCRLLLEK